MSVELNLWFSTTTSAIYGNINFNHKSVIEKFTKLLPFPDFCDIAIKKKFMTMAELEVFYNEPGRDHDALYAFTPSGSIVQWNTKKSTAYVRYKMKDFALPQNKLSMRAYAGMPDLYFRHG